MKPVHTLILLANEKEARFLMNEGAGKGVHQIEHHKFDEMPNQPGDYADSPGAQRAASGAALHAMDSHFSERERRRSAFAVHIIGLLDGIWKEGKYDRIVLSSSPRMLGELNGLLDAHLEDAMHAKLDKDLLYIPTSDLHQHLEKVIAV